MIPLQTILLVVVLALTVWMVEEGRHHSDY